MTPSSSFNDDTFSCVVAERRKEKSLPPLEPFVIDVISSSSSNLEHDDIAILRDTKMSSTAIRQWIVDREKRET